MTRLGPEVKFQALGETCDFLFVYLYAHVLCLYEKSWVGSWNPFYMWIGSHWKKGYRWIGSRRNRKKKKKKSYAELGRYRKNNQSWICSHSNICGWTLNIDNLFLLLLLFIPIMIFGSGSIVFILNFLSYYISKMGCNFDQNWYTH